MRELTLAGALLDPLLAADPVGPRITFYDNATGERIELSAVTLANWAAKTANLLRDEYGAGPGSTVAVLLPAHWQTAAVLLGAWWIGATVDVSGQSPAAVALCDANRLEEADDLVADAMGEVAVLSLDPFGKPVPDLPVGVNDYATTVRVHGDQIVPEPDPGPALPGLTAAEALAAAHRVAGERGLRPGERVLSTASWDTAEAVIADLLAVWAVGGSLVQVANPDPARLPRITETEKVTRALP